MPLLFLTIRCRALWLCILLALGACTGVQGVATPMAHFTLGLLPDTQGGTDAADQAHVALHPMRAVLRHQASLNVDMIIALGDLTDRGSTLEWQEWTELAQRYRQQGIEFFPVMGNHEASHAYAVEWVDNMRHFIPSDAIHMPGYEWLNYYVVRKNVLLIGLAYAQLPFAFDWIQQVVQKHEAHVEHIVVASHDGLIGAKYGQTREHIVDGIKDDELLFRLQPKIRQYFAQRDVIYVQGHEHQYQRSQIAAKTSLQTLPSSSTPTGGNYRMGAYTQIIAGNASYKGYDFRFGERELVQMIVAQKNATYDEEHGSHHFDVNSSLLKFHGPRVDYTSYYAEHQARSNAPEQAFDPQWRLLDKFSRTANRCEMMVYPDSVPTATRSQLVLQTRYISNDCRANNGATARLLGGTNKRFNRTDSSPRSMFYKPGFSRADSLADLTRLAYQWLFVHDSPWTPNLNSAARIIPESKTDTLLVPATTIDLKEHVTLSWLAGTADTLSDILIVSGTQNQTGIYQNAHGSIQGVGSGRGRQDQPTESASIWDISHTVADLYALEFRMPALEEAKGVVLGERTTSGWIPLASADCVVARVWDKSFLDRPPARASGCEKRALVGRAVATGRWWVVLDRDAEVGLIAGPHDQ